ncbi:probable tRNA (uracil-O(2)-)-methyltransferase [Diorhabda carinulata]|uniref:probable tRNA (uracil-O(2)-)-methyltransferase n=1 Tax=Diorhabda carinulata TaxID=1163345 RepID=UPI0025A1E185|nr:probable tRNA (uracil-O(2)-)-methyltransferase [Diorhabda carinulata]XP_057667451.1 probable tRNA (uracil-O(2)-)-methyltransferase [Diorhabda carinulata]
MFSIPLVTSSGGFNFPLFWEIVVLYLNRPYLVNKLITATTKIGLYKIEYNGNQINELFTKSAILYERRKLINLSKETVTEEFISNIIEYNVRNLAITKVGDEYFSNANTGVYISLQILISRKNPDHKVLEIVILDKDKNCATFMSPYERTEDILTPNFVYQFELNGNNFRINLQEFEDAETSRAEWLADTLFPKLLKWSQCATDKKNTVQSLSLVPLDEYCILYDRLKRNYVKGLIKDWLEKANTQKYIFEDLAIASYLICLWRVFEQENINFVDCGCGNGLLVYILNQEGYKGYGIDIRKRSIWDIYPKETRLEVGIVTPDSTFPESTWLIGNHSDELTPWIPLIALKSTTKTNFFLLPCCPYDFNGEKYIRTNTAVSTYADYLCYIEDICKKCKFKVQIDKLRIPSTKKVCLVGVSKFSTQEETCEVLDDIKPLINIKMNKEFKPRVKVEPVRNCTQLKREITDKIIKLIVDLLLKEENNIIKKKDGTFWNKGSIYLISDLSKNIPPEYLKDLKLQCGGLQTLMKNFRYIFEVNKGTVRLRKPTSYEETGEKYRGKPCWFQKNHPQCCYNSENDCSYYHV